MATRPYRSVQTSGGGFAKLHNAPELQNTTTEEEKEGGKLERCETFSLRRQRDGPYLDDGLSR